jgi:hypothetical protein
MPQVAMTRTVSRSGTAESICRGTAAADDSDTSALDVGRSPTLPDASAPRGASSDGVDAAADDSDFSEKEDASGVAAESVPFSPSDSD